MDKLSDHEIFERATESIALVENPVFREALKELRKRYYSELMEAGVGTLTATAAHAKLKALEDIPGQLAIFINDAKMRRK